MWVMQVVDLLRRREAAATILGTGTHGIETEHQILGRGAGAGTTMTRRIGTGQGRVVEEGLAVEMEAMVGMVEKKEVNADGVDAVAGVVGMTVRMARAMAGAPSFDRCL